MLAKQGWRLLTNPTSLATRMKEKYYKRGTIMDAKLGACPSQIWRSIWGFHKFTKRRAKMEGRKW